MSRAAGSVRGRACGILGPNPSGSAPEISETTFRDRVGRIVRSACQAPRTGSSGSTRLLLKTADVATPGGITPDQLSGRKLFVAFVATFIRMANKHGTSIWLYYRKYRLAPHSIKPSDWTPAVMTFLDYLAWKLRYVQLYERPLTGKSRAKRDGIWVRASRPDERLVVLEAENRPRTVFDSEVPKLLADSARLKVLITEHDYRDQESASDWRERFIERMRRTITESGNPIEPKGEVEFLLILADRVNFDREDWHGFSLTRRAGAWAAKWTPLAE